MRADLSYKSTNSPWWHHRDSDTADVAADVTTSIEAATADVGTPQPLADDASDYLINAAGSTGVDFTVAGLGHGASGTVTGKSLSPTLSANAVNPSQVPAGGTLELTSSYSGTLSFAGATGTLKIDNSSSFSGTIAGQLVLGDQIDLADITAGANA
jgi:hypothetical protein